MGTPAKNRKSVELGSLEADVNNYKQALQDIKQMEAYAAGLKKKIIKKIGNAEEATLGGVLAFTYARTGSFRWAEFATEHPQIADQYKVQVTQEVLDKDKLLADHGAILADYQSRQFLVKL